MKTFWEEEERLTRDAGPFCQKSYNLLNKLIYNEMLCAQYNKALIIICSIVINRDVIMLSFS